MKTYTREDVIAILKMYDDSIWNLDVFLHDFFYKDKYEKVEIGDFHVGFVFQWRNDKGDWVDKVMDSLDYRVESTMSLHRGYMLYPHRFRKLKTK